MKRKPYCEFCQIVARRLPGNIRYEDEEIIVINNKLRWAPVMLLVMPKVHMSQEELWSNGIMAKVGRTAVDMGTRFCPGDIGSFRTSVLTLCRVKITAMFTW